MKINAKKDKFMPTIILDITLEIFFLIPTILVFFLALDIKIELLGIIISLFILSVPNVFLIGNIVTGIKYYKGISIVIEEDTLYLNLLLPSKNISKKDKVYNPYKLITIPSNKFKCGAYIPKKYSGISLTQRRALLMHSKSWTMNAPAVTESPTHSRVF